MTDSIQIKYPASTARFSRRWMMPIAGLLLVAVVGGIWRATRAGGAPVKPEAKMQEKREEVQELAAADIAIVEARELRLALPVSGSLAPLTQATVKAKVPAEVRETLVQEGMKVARGQVIARLDTADLQARFATQQAALDEAQARLSLAQKNSATNQALLKQKFISQNAFDTTQNSVELAQANVKSAASQLEIARLAMADTVIHAPIDGIVSKRYVQPGEKVSPDMPLFSIVNLAQLTLEAQVPASEIPRVSVGQEVVFSVDGFPGRAFSGKVARINPTTEAGSRALLVYIAVANADGALRGGMFAKGGITLEKSVAAPLVPVTALRQENGVSILYKIENDRIVAQPVKLGLRNEDEGLVAVTEGIAGGARVLIANIDGVKPGNAVKMAQPASPAAPSADKKI